MGFNCRNCRVNSNHCCGGVNMRSDKRARLIVKDILAEYAKGDDWDEDLVDCYMQEVQVISKISNSKVACMFSRMLDDLAEADAYGNPAEVELILTQIKQVL